MKIYALFEKCMTAGWCYGAYTSKSEAEKAAHWIESKPCGRNFTIREVILDEPQVFGSENSGEVKTTLRDP